MEYFKCSVSYWYRYNLIIFQSLFQAYLFSNYHKNIFADGTFYTAPKFSYQLFITRIYVGEFNMFYTSSISILKNKKQSTYLMPQKKVFPNINIKYCVWHYKRSLEKQKNILCYHEVKNNNDVYFIIKLFRTYRL